jgi:transposase
MARHGLLDEQWAVLQQVLPAESSTGRPPHDRRRMIDGILFVLKTGCPWRDVLAEFGKWSTIYERFRLWSHAGVWELILSALQARKQASGEIDWELFCIDGTVIRAHKAAAGASKKR